MQVSGVRKNKTIKKPKTPNRTRFPAKQKSPAEFLPFLPLSEANIRHSNQARVKNEHTLLFHVWISMIKDIRIKMTASVFTPKSCL